MRDCGRPAAGTVHDPVAGSFASRLRESNATGRGGGMDRDGIITSSVIFSILRSFSRANITKQFIGARLLVDESTVTRLLYGNRGKPYWPRGRTWREGARARQGHGSDDVPCLASFEAQVEELFFFCFETFLEEDFAQARAITCECLETVGVPAAEVGRFRAFEDFQPLVRRLIWHAQNRGIPMRQHVTPHHPHPTPPIAPHPRNEISLSENSSNELSLNENSLNENSRNKTGRDKNPQVEPLHNENLRNEISLNHISRNQNSFNKNSCDEIWRNENPCNENPCGERSCNRTRPNERVRGIRPGGEGCRDGRVHGESPRASTSPAARIEGEAALPADGSVRYFPEGFETHALYGSVLARARRRLWVLGRKNKKMFDRSYVSFYQDAAPRIAAGELSLRCLFLDPNSAPALLDHAQKRRAFPAAIRACVADAFDMLQECEIDPACVCRFYACMRNDAIIIVDDFVLHAPVKYDVDGRPYHLTNCPFTAVRADSQIGRVHVAEFERMWNAACFYDCLADQG